jgi:hypothetical protein
LVSLGATTKRGQVRAYGKASATLPRHRDMNLVTHPPFPSLGRSNPPRRLQFVAFNL